jgi:hypothetical protein
MDIRYRVIRICSNVAGRRGEEKGEVVRVRVRVECLGCIVLVRCGVEG